MQILPTVSKFAARSGPVAKMPVDNNKKWLSCKHWQVR